MQENIEILHLETGNRIKLKIKSTDTVDIIKNKIFLSDFNIPAIWQYLYTVSADNQELALSHQIKNSVIGMPHADKKYQNGERIADKNIINLGTSIPNIINNFLVVSNLEQALINSGLALEVRSDVINSFLLKELRKTAVFDNFCFSFIRRFWPLADKKQVELIIWNYIGHNLKEFKVDADLIAEYKKMKEQFEIDKKIIIEEFNTLNKIVPVKNVPDLKLNQLFLSINTDTTLDLNVIFKKFSLSPQFPFIKFKRTLTEKTGQEKEEVLFNVLESFKKDLKNRELLKTWVKNKPRGLNFKIKIADYKYTDASILSNGIIFVICSANLNKGKCLEEVQKLIRKINRETSFNLQEAGTNNTAVSSLIFSAIIKDQSKRFDHISFLSFILTDKLYKKFFGLNPKLSKLLDQKERLLKKTKIPEKSLKLVESKIKYLQKENLTNLSYHNKFYNSQANVTIITGLKSNDVKIKISGISSIEQAHEVNTLMTTAITFFLNSYVTLDELADLPEEETKPAPKDKKLTGLAKMLHEKPDLFISSSYAQSCSGKFQPIMMDLPEVKELKEDQYTYALKYQDKYYVCRRDTEDKGKKIEFPYLQPYKAFIDLVVINKNTKEVLEVVKNLSDFGGKNSTFQRMKAKLEKQYIKKDLAVEFIGQPNNRKNKLYWPCCSKSDERDKLIVEDLEHKIYSSKLSSIVAIAPSVTKEPTRSGAIIHKPLTLEPDRIGNWLPVEMLTIFAKDVYKRYGIRRSESSLFEAVLASTEEKYRKASLKEKEEMATMFRNDLADKLTDKVFISINDGEIASMMSFKNFQSKIKQGLTDIELLHDYLSRVLKINLFVFSAKNDKLLCLKGHSLEKNVSVFLLEKETNHYEVVFDHKNNKFNFANTPEVIKTIKAYKANCPAIKENTLQQLFDMLKGLKGQIINFKGKVIYAVTEQNLILPVKESAPLELDKLTLSDILEPAKTVLAKLKKLSKLYPQFDPVSQIKKGPKTVALILKNGSIVPVLASPELLFFPVEKNLEYLEDLDFYIHKGTNIENAQTKFTKKMIWQKELLQRVRYQMSQLLKSNKTARSEIIKHIANDNEMKKILNKMILVYGGASKSNKSIDDPRDIPLRENCEAKMTELDCVQDPFCGWSKNNKCQLNISAEDKNKIVFAIVNEFKNRGQKSAILTGKVSDIAGEFILRKGEVILKNIQEAIDYVATV